MIMSWFTYAIIVQVVWILTVIYAFREQISAFKNGIRYIRWLELDTGRQGYTILDKSLDSCTINGQVKTVNKANIFHGWMFFVNDNCENLKIEDAKDKWQFYCNSEEFDTVFKNKIFEQLMMVMQKNLIYLVLFAVIVAIIIGIYNAYEINGAKTAMEAIVAKATSLEAQYGK